MLFQLTLVHLNQAAAALAAKWCPTYLLHSQIKLKQAGAPTLAVLTSVAPLDSSLKQSYPGEFHLTTVARVHTPWHPWKSPMARCLRTTALNSLGLGYLKDHHLFQHCCAREVTELDLPSFMWEDTTDTVTLMGSLQSLYPLPILTLPTHYRASNSSTPHAIYTVFAGRYLFGGVSCLSWFKGSWALESLLKKGLSFAIFIHYTIISECTNTCIDVYIHVRNFPSIPELLFLLYDENWFKIRG